MALGQQEKVKEFFDKWTESIDLEEEIKKWLRHHVKYGSSCPYCGLPSEWPGKAHKECGKEV